MDEQDVLKVLKHQANRVENLKKDTKGLADRADQRISKSEDLLKQLGYDVSAIGPQNQVHTRSQAPIELKSWDDLVSEADQAIEDGVYYSDLLSEDEIRGAFDKLAGIEADFDRLNKVSCDKYDYMIAGTCGTISGLIDVFLVGVPGDSVIGNKVDEQANKMVENIAEKLGWNKETALKKAKKRAEQKGEDGEVSVLSSAIAFLERGGKLEDTPFRSLLEACGLVTEDGKFKGFKVNYDQSTGKAVKDSVLVSGNKKAHEKFKMSTSNHHLKSLAHSPSPIGLLVSILNQFTNTATFVDKGKMVTVRTDNFELVGSTFPAKIFAGFVNWIGHIISDCAGSNGAQGRGSGVPIPFFELFQFVNIGSFGQHRQTFAQISVQVFEQGYDARHGVAMAIPVLINELLVRLMWTLKQHFYNNKKWLDALPRKHDINFDRVLFTSYGCFCLVDLGDAALKSGGNAVLMLTRMNIVSWTRFGQLGYKEAKRAITYDSRKNAYVSGELEKQWHEMNAEMTSLLRDMK